MRGIVRGSVRERGDKRVIEWRVEGQTKRCRDNAEEHDQVRRCRKREYRRSRTVKKTYKKEG
jgi:hypothetical protein